MCKEHSVGMVDPFRSLEREYSLQTHGVLNVCPFRASHRYAKRQNGRLGRRCGSALVSLVDEFF